MDVLEYWAPCDRLGQFHQGPLSDRMWSAFKNLVLLCHAAEYWRDAVRANRLTAQPRPMYTLKLGICARSALTSGAGHFGNPKPICTVPPSWQTRRCRNAYLIGPGDQGKPDHSLWFACALSVGRSLGHERARYKSVAFSAFNADADLAGADPSVTAKRWLTNAGFADADPTL